ncbi:MAG: amino acid ABC transporter permease [Bacillota bacterium]
MDNLTLAITIWQRIYNTTINKNFYTLYISGIGVVFSVAIGACVLGILLGSLVAYARIAPQDKLINRILARFCKVYVTFIRGMPLAILLLIMYYIVFSSMKTVWNGVLIGIITFGLNSGAYVSEILRGGISAVDKGQLEAGRSLGFTWGQSMTRIVLPQGIKSTVPSLFNEFIMLVKETSILGFVGIVDLTKGAQMVISQTYDVYVPYLLIAAIYLIIILLLEQLQKRIERRLGKGDRN